MQKDKLVSSWLSEYKSEATRHSVEVRFNRFLEWSNKTPQQLSKLRPKEAKHLILQFQSEMVKQGVKNNTVLAFVSATKNFFEHCEIAIKFRKGQLVKPQSAKGYHDFSNGDLASIFRISNTQYKALWAVAASGFSIAEILNLDKQLIEATVKNAIENNERFAYIELVRGKTEAKSLLVLNPLAIEWLDKWLSQNKEPALWSVKENAVNRMLKQLAKRSGINLKGKIKFHKIRSWTMVSLSKAGFGEFAIKYQVGKSIPLSDETYLRLRSEIEEKYPKIYEKYLSLTPTTLTPDKAKHIEELEKEAETLRTILISLIGKDKIEKALEGKVALHSGTLEELSTKELLELYAKSL